MRLLVLPGHGIGTDILDAALQVLGAAGQRFGLGLRLEPDDVGFVSLRKHGTTLRQEVLERPRTFDGLILGTQSHADYPAPEQGGRHISAAFRVEADLYANVRLARTRPVLHSGMRPGRSRDRVIMRDNGLLSGPQNEPGLG